MTGPGNPNENSQDLAEEIKNFCEKARQLEEIREGLVKKISELMHQKIIPEIEPLLPEYYSICREESEVNKGTIGFGVELRVHYDNKPIPRRGPQHEEFYDMQHDLQQKLSEISKKYRVLVMVNEEPKVIG